MFNKSKSRSIQNIRKTNNKEEEGKEEEEIIKIPSKTVKKYTSNNYKNYKDDLEEEDDEEKNINEKIKLQKLDKKKYVPSISFNNTLESVQSTSISNSSNNRSYHKEELEYLKRTSNIIATNLLPQKQTWTGGNYSIDELNKLKMDNKIKNSNDIINIYNNNMEEDIINVDEIIDMNIDMSNIINNEPESLYDKYNSQINNSSLIPDDKLIAEAKAKRARMSGNANAPAYIPVRSKYEDEEFDNNETFEDNEGKRILTSNLYKQNKPVKSSIVNDLFQSMAVEDSTLASKFLPGEDTLLKMKKRIESMKEEVSKNKSDIEKFNLELKTCDVTSINFENQIAELNTKYQYFQEMKSNFFDIIDFLTVKGSLIDEASDELNHLISSTYSRVNEEVNRQINLRDKLAFPNSNTTELKFDEFGRSVTSSDEFEESQLLRMLKKRRERRMDRQDYKLILGADCEGCSDIEDDNPLISNDFKSKKQALLDDVALILGDAKEHFQTIDYVIKLFDTWKKEQSQFYNDAYAALSIPGLVAPYIKLELMKWDPLENPHIKKMYWFSELDKFDKNEISIEKHFMPKIFDKIIIPYCLNVIENQWNPYSINSSASLYSLVKELSGVSHSISINKILTFVGKKLNELVSKPLPKPPSLLNVTSETREQEFLRLNFWQSLILLHNIHHLSSIFPKSFSPDIDLQDEFFIKTLFVKHFTFNLLPYFEQQISFQPSLNDYVLPQFRGSMPSHLGNLLVMIFCLGKLLIIFKSYWHATFPMFDRFELYSKRIYHEVKHLYSTFGPSSVSIEELALCNNIKELGLNL